jgi:hypothetical protein
MAPPREPALQSKKFWAFLISTFGWDLLIGWAIYRWLPLTEWSTLILFGMVMVQGIVAIGFIVGQAGLEVLAHLFEVLGDIFGKVKPPV